MSSAENTPRGDEAPPELIDPITLAVMENAVMVTPCGHSFSTASISSWLRQCGGGAKTCPVCKSVISESLIPNWALRNAVDRYNQKYGKKRASSSFDEPLPFQGQVHIELGDYPVKPSAPPAVLASSASSASSFNSEDDMPARPATTTTTTTTTTVSSSSLAQAAPAQVVHDDGADCECCERPTGDRGCCAWECEQCGVCKMADDCSGQGCLLIFPTSTVTCQGSFGKWSNWYSRTFCGSIYPIFVGLVLLLFCLDIVFLCVFWTLWSFLVPLGMLFFLFTHYFCPCVNRGVSRALGDYAFVVGQVCPS